MAGDCVGVSKLAASATVNNGTLIRRTTGAKSGRSKVNFGVSELCSQCFMHDCLSGELCSVQGSPDIFICMTCSVCCEGGK